MPARTNPYQELVVLIERALAGPGVEIKQSVLEAVPGQTRLREVDILRTTTEGTRVTRVAIEVKDEKRPIDVERVEMYFGKFTGKSAFPVDQVILVARRGFTSTAREKAKAEGIKLLTLAQAREVDWKTMGIPQADLSTFTTLNVDVKPRVRKVVVEPPLPPDVERSVICEGRIVCICCGKDSGTLAAFISRGLKDDPVDQRGREIRQQFHEMLRSNSAVKAAWTFPEKKRLRHNDKLYPIRRLEVTIQGFSGKAKVERTTYEMVSDDGESQVVHEFCAEVGPSRFRFLVPSGEKGKKIAMQISSTKGNDKPRRVSELKKAPNRAQRRRKKK